MFGRAIPLIQKLSGMEPFTLEPPRDPVEPVLDWKAYYDDFKQRHGNHPLLIGGRLVFADGWSYSSTDYSGPEWAPPSDRGELKGLLNAYWLKRRSIVVGSLRHLTRTFTLIKEQRQMRDGDLFMRVTDEDSKVSAAPLDLSMLEERIAWLKTDVEQCNEELRSLNHASTVL